jgi:carboxymethylenebutenolidase
MVDTFRDELARHGVAGVVEIAPGTHHGFAMADLSVYEPQAAERHFERTLDLWRRNLAGEPARTA